MINTNIKETNIGLAESGKKMEDRVCLHGKNFIEEIFEICPGNAVLHSLQNTRNSFLVLGNLFLYTK